MDGRGGGVSVNLNIYRGREGGSNFFVLLIRILVLTPVNYLIG